MADYYPLLSKAVAGLSPNTPEARQGIYDRARLALTRQLASIDPPVDAAVVERELSALTGVFERIEREQGEGGLQSEPDSPAAAPETDLPAPQAPETVARPQVIRRERAAGRNPLAAVGLAVGAVVVVAIATLAYLRRNEPPAVPNRTAGVTQPAPGGNASSSVKTGDRVQPSAEDSPARRPADPPAAPPRPPAQTAPPGAASGNVPTSTSSPPAASQPQIGVANRMVLAMENSEDSQKVDVRQGTVVWRTELVAGGQGQPPQQAIRATVDVPDARLRAEITIQRNLDPAFPASHTIQIQFSNLGGGGVGPIQTLSQIELRQAESQPGYPLAGQGIAVMENVFLVALAQVEPALSRNVEMMRTRPLLYLEFVTAGGRRGGMVMEKGVSGQQAFDEAFRSWQ
ncbi:MAG: hypothetical protein IOC90_07840 [Methylocystis sp.]|jgi:hypothetical protein|nr:hypothetical protein [Methylocystis sp.]MCA3582180.1 hypothetical protein [Methylocystis sp.]MCA3587928.1 hypothetical protein [Methylocystis sp.]MCA3590241.1 hypothetical protein [Methylocystis sp.]